MMTNVLGSNVAQVPPRMTDAELAAIQARCDAASPGPWGDTKYSPPGDANGQCYCFSLSAPHRPTTIYAYGPNSRANIDFASHARQDIPALLAEVNRLRAGHRYVSHPADDVPKHSE